MKRLPALLFHATPSANLPLILEEGLQPGHCGRIHRGLELRPPLPTVYLSRTNPPQNVHTAMFAQGPVAVLAVDTAGWDETLLWPDDFLFEQVARGDLLDCPGDIASKLGLSCQEAEQFFEALEAADATSLPSLLQPWWSWYLADEMGGEISYAGVIPAAAIRAVFPWPTQG